MTNVYDPPIRFHLYDWEGKLTHKCSERVSDTDDLPQVIQWRGRTFITRNEPVDREFEEAATLTLDDDDGVFAPVKPTPTLEDVDARLQPKGLPVIELTMPMWVGPWRDSGGDVWRRLLLAYYPTSPFIWQCQVERRVNGTWDATRQGYPPADDKGCYGHPTPEAAQAACEAAIVTAWRTP